MEDNPRNEEQILDLEFTPTIRRIHSGSESSTDKILKRIVKDYKTQKGKSYVLFQKPITRSDYTMEIYHLDSNQAAQINRKNSVVFVTIKDSIYCLTLGQGYHLVKKSSDSNFSNQALKCMATNEVSKIEARELRGMYTARTLYFRTPEIPQLISSTGIVTKVHTRVNNESFLTNDGLKIRTEHSKNGYKIEATRNSFTICKSLKLKEIIEILSNLHKELPEGGTGCDVFDYVKVVDDEKLNDSLEKLLIDQIDNDVRKNDKELDSTPPFDFIYKDDLDNDCRDFTLGNRTDKTAEVSSYKDAILLYKAYKQKNDDQTVEKLKDLRLKFRLGKKTCDEKFLDLFQGEQVHEGKVYGKINGEWLEFNSDFRKQINDAYITLIRNKLCEGNNKTVVLEKKWGNIEEYDYCLKYASNSKEFLVGDRVIVPDGIELFDIMKVTEDALLLYHVKKGFLPGIRAVCSQIRIGANLIRSARYLKEGEENCLESLLKTAQKLNPNSNENIERKALVELQKKAFELFSKDHLLEMFWKKQVVYVYAFKNVDRNKNDWLLQKDNVDVYPVNDIARHELIHTNMCLEELGFQFRICQIQCESPSNDAGTVGKQAVVNNLMLTEAIVEDMTIDHAKVKDMKLGKVKVKDMKLNRAVVTLNQDVPNNKSTNQVVLNHIMEHGSDGTLNNAMVEVVTLDDAKVTTMTLENAMVEDLALESAKVVDMKQDENGREESSSNNVVIKSMKLKHAKVKGMKLNLALSGDLA